jgi:hypothetical protein
MLKEFIRVHFIVSISYVLLKFTREFKEIYLKNQFNFFKYDFLDRIFICMFFILFIYNILLIYCAAKVLIKFIRSVIFNKNNQAIKINLENHFILTEYNDEMTSCPICLDDFCQENDICKLIQCSHYYHLKCIKKWYDSQYNNLQIEPDNRNYLKHLSCPLCRAYKKDKEI